MSKIKNIEVNMRVLVRSGNYFFIGKVLAPRGGLFWVGNPKLDRPLLVATSTGEMSNGFIINTFYDHTPYVIGRSIEDVYAVIDPIMAASLQVKNKPISAVVKPLRPKLVPHAYYMNLLAPNPCIYQHTQSMGDPSTHFFKIVARPSEESIFHYVIRNFATVAQGEDEFSLYDNTDSFEAFLKTHMVVDAQTVATLLRENSFDRPEIVQLTLSAHGYMRASNQDIPHKPYELRFSALRFNEEKWKNSVLLGALYAASLSVREEVRASWWSSIHVNHGTPSESVAKQLNIGVNHEITYVDVDFHPDTKFMVTQKFLDSLEAENKYLALPDTTRLIITEPVKNTRRLVFSTPPIIEQGAEFILDQTPFIIEVQEKKPFTLGSKAPSSDFTEINPDDLYTFLADQMKNPKWKNNLGDLLRSLMKHPILGYALWSNGMYSTFYKMSALFSAKNPIMCSYGSFNFLNDFPEFLEMMLKYDGKHVSFFTLMDSVDEITPTTLNHSIMNF